MQRLRKLRAKNLTCGKTDDAMVIAMMPFNSVHPLFNRVAQAGSSHARHLHHRSRVDRVLADASERMLEMDSPSYLRLKKALVQMHGDEAFYAAKPELQRMLRENLVQNASKHDLDIVDAPLTNTTIRNKMSTM